MRDNYLELADSYGFEVVDASRPADEVFADVMRIVEEVI